MTGNPSVSRLSTGARVLGGVLVLAVLTGLGSTWLLLQRVDRLETRLGQSRDSVAQLRVQLAAQGAAQTKALQDATTIPRDRQNLMEACTTALIATEQAPMYARRGVLAVAPCSRLSDDDRLAAWNRAEIHDWASGA